jgi:hypothetical protein
MVIYRGDKCPLQGQPLKQVTNKVGAREFHTCCRVRPDTLQGIEIPSAQHTFTMLRLLGNCVRLDYHHEEWLQLLL